MCLKDSQKIISILEPSKLLITLFHFQYCKTFSETPGNILPGALIVLLRKRSYICLKFELLELKGPLQFLCKPCGEEQSSL